MPDWFKAMPQKGYSEINQKDLLTMKKCPPVIDAMAYGFLLPLVSDLRVEKGEFFWDRDVPSGSITSLTHSPIDYHDNVQVAGTPFFDDDRFIIKFNNFWTIETPPGYSLLFTHPLNRSDLPFTTLARHRVQWCAAEGHARGAMHSGQAREVGGAFRCAVERSDRAAQRNGDEHRQRVRHLPTRIPRAEALARFICP
jgi:hypothetical protein